MMDSWKYLAQQRGVFISEELDFPFDGNDNGSCNKNNNLLIGNEMKPMYSFENYPPFDRLDSMEMCFSDDIRKSSYSNEPSGDVFSTGTGTDSCGNVVVSPFYDGNVAVSSGVMSQSAKGARFSSTSLYPKTSICQVYGCNKDLSSYKGYYKRHKVCDVHTKTAKVIVEGIEQRFCQQCSRFHRLAEFDDGKRSCRRRLTAHNKRRRKPQHVSESGSRIIGFSSSLALPDMFPNSDIDSARKGTGNIANGMKDDTLDLESLSSIQRTTSALSLLSAQSLNIPTQLLEAAITSPLINKSGSHAPGMYLAGANHAKPTLINHYNDANSTVYLKFQDDSVSVEPYLRNNHYDNDTDYHNNPLGRGVVLDLLQLSSHLQRIEHQKHSTESGA